jgi:acyl carrier protein
MTKTDKIRAIIKEVSKKEPADDDESLFDSGLLDSFAVTDLVASLEQQFGVKVPDNDLRPRNFDSVNRIESYLLKLGA